jgi:hypothetical protein
MLKPKRRARVTRRDEDELQGFVGTDESMGIDPNDEEQVRVWERQQQGWRRRGNTDPEDDNA